MVRLIKQEDLLRANTKNDRSITLYPSPQHETKKLPMLALKTCEQILKNLTFNVYN